MTMVNGTALQFIRRRCVLLCIATLGLANRTVVAQTAGQSCPDATDTPQLLGYYVGVAFRALTTEPSRPLPPPCLFAAIATRAAAEPDSTIDQALAVSDVALKRRPDDADLLNAELLFLARLKRAAEVAPVFDRLIASDSARATLGAFKVVIAAAQRAADTASMTRYLAQATSRYPAAAQLVAEYSILTQVPRLRALIDTVHASMKADSRRIYGYASLASIYGSLEQPDSAFKYIRRGLVAGVPRPTMVAALRSLVGGQLRHAQLQDAMDVWERTLNTAFAIDSVMSTPETKHLVALSISRVAIDRTDTLHFYLPPLQLGHGYGKIESIDITRAPTSRTDEACSSITSMTRLIAYGGERLASGGNQFAPETAPAIERGFALVRDRLLPLKRGCETPDPLTAISISSIGP